MRMLRLILECCAPLHCGGGANDFLQDQPVVRDAFGFWHIPGSTLAGILRHHAATLAPEEVVDRVFGKQEKDFPRPSLIWCANGQLLDYDGRFASLKAIHGEPVDIPRGPFIRDHVRIDLKRGVAEIGGKFDEEIVPPGARFAMEITLDGWSRPLLEDELDLFDRLCQALIRAELSLGGKAGSGYGRYNVLHWACRDFDLTIPAGMEAYLNLSPGPDFREGEGVLHVFPEGQSVRPGQGCRGVVTFPLRALGPLLVGGTGDEENDTDITCFHSPVLDYERRKCRRIKVIPGTSFKGVVRHRAYDIACALGLDADIATSILNRMFGYVDGNDAQCGKIVFCDANLDTLTKKAPVTRVQHVAIDRFTGGALDGALYDEAPVWADALDFELILYVDGLEDHEAALLLHALLDMAEGMLPVGGGGNRGNGILGLRYWDQDSAQALRGIAGELWWRDESLFSGTERTWKDWVNTLNTALHAQGRTL